ncbi:hypothetical protein CsSME_00016733 [Camellia sinensis var. sinensis]
MGLVVSRGNLARLGCSSLNKGGDQDKAVRPGMYNRGKGFSHLIWLAVMRLLGELKILLGVGQAKWQSNIVWRSANLINKIIREELFLAQQG